jgi:hypothetical protein
MKPSPMSRFAMSQSKPLLIFPVHSFSPICSTSSSPSGKTIGWSSSTRESTLKSAKITKAVTHRIADSQRHSGMNLGYPSMTSPPTLNPITNAATSKPSSFSKHSSRESISDFTPLSGTSCKWWPSSGREASNRLYVMILEDYLSNPFSSTFRISK